MPFLIVTLFKASPLPGEKVNRHWEWGIGHMAYSPCLPDPPIPQTVFWATNCTPNVILVLQRLNLYLSVNKHYGFCRPIDRRDSS